MLFHSVGFLLVFLPLFLITMQLIPKGMPRSICLLLFSYLFYSGAEPYFVLILLLSSIVDYSAALLLHGSSRVVIKRFYLILSVTVNLGLLIFFKYGAMLLPSVTPVGQMLGLPIPNEDFYKGFILPAGISFYTFQSMSYTIDVYRGLIKPEKNLLGFFNYVAYLPQLIAGPIERFGNLSPQISTMIYAKTERLWTAGIDRITLGIAQKLLIADSCGYIVDHLVSAGGPYSFFSAWAIAVGFGMQIYYDFSAYTHIAIGISLLFGIRLTENFLSPYKSTNIQEFWRRWHITLSNWFRDYLYISLGGSKHGWLRTFLNVILTFGLCGLWHGAGWNYIAWGLMHGILVGGYHVMNKIIRVPILPPFLAVALTFATIHLVWVPFRVADPLIIGRIWQGMFGLEGFGLGLVSLPDLVFISIVTALTLWLPNASQRWPGSSGWLESLALMGIALFAIFNTPEITQFIYFQF